MKLETWNLPRSTVSITERGAYFPRRFPFHQKLSPANNDQNSFTMVDRNDNMKVDCEN